MKRFFIDKLGRIIKLRKQIEKELDVVISNKGKEITINGTPEEEYIAEKVIDAVDFGFALEIALLIRDEDYLFEIINIKNYTKKNRFGKNQGKNYRHKKKNP